MTIRELEEYGKLAGEYWHIQRNLQQGAGGVDEKRRLKEVNRRLSAISDYILGCSDPLIRELMLHKFIELKSWEEVAMCVGGYNSSGSCRMLVMRYIGRENKK